MAAPPAVNVATIAAAQRAALVWRLRCILHEGDQRGLVRWRNTGSPNLSEIAKSEFIRSALLALIAEIEGAEHPGQAGR